MHRLLALATAASLFAVPLACVEPDDGPPVVVEHAVESSEGPRAITQTECDAALAGFGVSHRFETVSGVPTAVRLLDAGPGVALVYDSPRGSETAGSLLTSCAAAIGLARTVASTRADGHAISVLYHVGSYFPRPIAGTDTPSAHTFALAIDVRGVGIVGRRYVLSDDRGSAPLASLERNLRATFKLVLGPEYNSDHRDHWHVEQPSGEQASNGFEVVRPLGGDALYVAEANRIHRVYSLASLLALGPVATRTVTAGQLASYVPARSIDGSDQPLLKTPDSPDLYVVRDGRRWLLDDEAAFYACTGLADFGAVFAHATPALLATWPVAGTLHRSDCVTGIADADQDGIPDGTDVITPRGGTRLCIVRTTFAAADPGPFAVAGDSVGGWDYRASNAAQLVGGELCFDFPSGTYRITWRTPTTWALYGGFCATYRDRYCTRDASGSYGIGFTSQNGALTPVAGDE